MLETAKLYQLYLLNLDKFDQIKHQYMSEYQSLDNLQPSLLQYVYSLMGTTNTNVQFKPSFDQNKVTQKVISSMQQNTFGQVLISNGKWNQLKIAKYTKYMDVWDITVLNLHTNYCPTILTEIRDINFRNLRQIDVERNNLVSVQKIGWINMPRLSILSLGSNALSNVGSELRKIPFPTELTTLSLRKNCIRECDLLSQMLAPSLQSLLFQFWFDDPNQVHNLRFICKMPSKKLTMIAFRAPYRLKDKFLILEVGEKYPDSKEICQYHKD